MSANYYSFVISPKAASILLFPSLAIITTTTNNNIIVQAASGCSVNFNIECNWVNQNSIVTYTSTSIVDFGVMKQLGDNDTSTSYAATVTFDWDITSSTSTDMHPINQTIIMNDTYVYNGVGEFKAGFSVLFGEGAGSCENRTASKMVALTVDDRSCTWSEMESTTIPISSPVTSTQSTSAAATTVMESPGADTIQSASPLQSTTTSPTPIDPYAWPPLPSPKPTPQPESSSSNRIIVQECTLLACVLFVFLLLWPSFLA